MEIKQTTVIHNGTYTLINEGGVHRTFAIKTQDKDAKFAPGERTVGLLSGTDNERSYTGFGFVKEDRIIVWKSKRGENGTMSAYEWYAEMLVNAAKAIADLQDQEEPEAEFIVRGNRYKVMVSKRCMKCNRKLTTPESIRMGIGPVCAGGGTDPEKEVAE